LRCVALRCVERWAALFVLSTLIIWGIANEARAQISFTPIACPVCPTLTSTSWKLRYGLDKATTELPLHQNCAGTPTNPCPHYSNNLKYTRYMSGNSYIKYVQFYAHRKCHSLLSAWHASFLWKVEYETMCEK